jgi:hypothetical protein
MPYAFAGGLASTTAGHGLPSAGRVIALLRTSGLSQSSWQVFWPFSAIEPAVSPVAIGDPRIPEFSARSRSMSRMAHG